VTTPVVASEHITKSYGQGDATVRALDDVSVEVGAGEFLLVRGPSGSGKTTLLHCLSTIATPDSGRVMLDGTDVAGLDDEARSDLRARSMGFVFQRFNLLPALTVGENVDLPLVMLGFDRDRVTHRTGEVLRTVGLEGRRDDFPDRLSGGQLQLAAVARAIAAEPRVVWTDEPTGSLDSESAERVLRALRSIVDEGGTLVLVSHDPAVERFADRVVTLRDGRLEA
jgi:putative ABC transport system ATP-binding protein